MAALVGVVLPAPPIAFPQHHLGSATLAMPRVKSEIRKHALLKNAPPLGTVHPVATARGAADRVTRSAHLNRIPCRRSPCALVGHVFSPPNHSPDMPSPLRQVLRSASCSVGFFPTQWQGRWETESPGGHYLIPKIRFVGRKKVTSHSQ